MSFKENLLKKISYDQMKQRALASLGPAGGGSKIDKKAMKELLGAAGYRYMSLRGLELYIPEGNEEGGKQKILVLDNDLPVYHSTVNDVALRKEPTLKEMISIKNAIRILNDSDVVISRKEKSVELVYQKCMAGLDLAFTSEDIKKLEYDGRAAVEWNDTEAVVQSLTLFSELLNYVSEPKVFRIDNHYIRGAMSRDVKGKERFGPSVVYRVGDGTIRMIRERIVLSDKDGIQLFHEMVQGIKDPACFGPQVFEWLCGEVLRINNLKPLSPAE